MNFIKDQKGQTIIEAVLAIAVIVIALFSFVTLSTQNFLNSEDAMKRLVATNLAREGIEVVRNVRDSNWLHGCADPEQFDPPKCYRWISSLYKYDDGRNEYYTMAWPIFDPTANPSWALNFYQKMGSFDDGFTECINNDKCHLYLNNDTSIYIPSAENAKETPYYRMLEIRPICNDNEERIEEYDCLENFSGSFDPYKSEYFNRIVALKVTSEVRWKYANVWNKSSLTEYLYNWR